MTYNGNQLSSVRDNASRMAYAGATDFDGVAGQEYLLGRICNLPTLSISICNAQ
jgi:hypothetical protein